jgi:hypothetical protein
MENWFIDTNLPGDYTIWAPSELALGSSPRQVAGTMDSYLLVVSGVNPRWGDQSESAVVVRSGPARLVRGTTAQPHQNQGITAYENHPTSSYPTRTRARYWSCITSGSGVA